MTRLRRIVRSHPGLAALVVAAALLLRFVVPAGFMPVIDHGRITITLCSGAGPMKMAMAMPGMAHHGGPASHDQQAPEVQSPCAYADLALPALPGADPVLLVAALAFVFAAALRPLVARVAGSARYLRPPLRGPPLPA